MIPLVQGNNVLVAAPQNPSVFVQHVLQLTLVVSPATIRGMDPAIRNSFGYQLDKIAVFVYPPEQVTVLALRPAPEANVCRAPLHMKRGRRPVHGPVQCPTAKPACHHDGFAKVVTGWLEHILGQLSQIDPYLVELGRIVNIVLLRRLGAYQLLVGKIRSTRYWSTVFHRSTPQTNVMPINQQGRAATRKKSWPHKRRSPQ